MNEKQEPKNASVEVAAIVAKANVPFVTVAIRPNLWHHWTQIAIRAEKRAIEARQNGLAAIEAGADRAQSSADETFESMVAVSASRSALRHLAADWRELGLLEGVKIEEIPLEATTDYPEDVDGWLAEIKLLIDDRNEIEHQPQATTTAEPHPAYPSNVSSIAAYYTTERATSAVDLLLGFYHRVINSPSDRLAKWASDRKHVPASFDGDRHPA